MKFVHRVQRRIIECRVLWKTTRVGITDFGGGQVIEIKPAQLVLGLLDARVDKADELIDNWECYIALVKALVHI